jgi:phytanoyl-CoA hydroxylase
MNEVRQAYNRDGFWLAKGCLPVEYVTAVKSEAQAVFARQLRRLGLLDGGDFSEPMFMSAMRAYFATDLEGFINCGRTCQRLLTLNRLGLDELLLEGVRALGISSPTICTQPVIYFNSRYLAKTEVYYKYPPHQDWRSMQGSLNAMVVWIPLVDVDLALGALEVIPGSHLWGLVDSQEDDWYRSIPNLQDDAFRSVEVEAGDALFFSSFLVHRSGNNTTEDIRWSCHFRYNDLDEPSYAERKFVTPYIYRPQQELVTPGFPDLARLAFTYANPAQAVSSEAL